MNGRRPRPVEHYEQKKVCTDCGVSKILAEFPAKMQRGGRLVRGRCYECQAEIDVARRGARREGEPSQAPDYGPQVGAAGMRAWLLTYEARGRDWILLAKSAGVDEGTFRKIMSGEQRSVGLDIPDRVALVACCDLDDVVGVRTCAHCGTEGGWPWDEWMRLWVPTLVFGWVWSASLDYCPGCTSVSEPELAVAA